MSVVTNKLSVEQQLSEHLDGKHFPLINFLLVDLLREEIDLAKSALLTL